MSKISQKSLTVGMKFYNVKLHESEMCLNTCNIHLFISKINFKFKKLSYSIELICVDRRPNIITITFTFSLIKNQKRGNA